MALFHTLQGASARAKKQARQMGVPLDNLSVWSSVADADDEWVFGPNPRLDNINQNVPQVDCRVMSILVI